MAGDVHGGGQKRVCMMGVGGGMRGRSRARVQKRRPLKRAVRILLECILVLNEGVLFLFGK